MGLWQQRCRLGLIPIGVTLAVLGLQGLGILQILEWALLNQWFRLRPLDPEPLPIVLVLISEADIQWAKQWPLSDTQLVALLNRLKQSHPAVIGLDLYRDFPIEPGHADLLEVFRTTPNLIGITKVIGNPIGPAIAPPPILGDRDQIGANDLLLDADGTLRRNLLYLQPQPNQQVILSLGMQLALTYLQQQGVAPPKQVGECLFLGRAKFCRLGPHTGGYVRVDNGGFQILSNFVHPAHTIPAVSLMDVMNNQVPVSQLQNKIVLVGVKADSVWGDRFYTPYTLDSTGTWAGIEIHANVVAQILESALEGRPVLQGLPEPLEWIWVFLWAGIGITIGWSVRSLWKTVVLIPLSVSSLFGIAYGLFLLGWWAIVFSPLIALLVTALISRSYWVWQTLRETNQILERKVQERTQELLEKNMALEQAWLVAETANHELQKVARIDGLTQIANRRFFNEFLEQEWNRMMRTQEPLSLILIDVDFFKRYNDTYGHPAGDACLVKIAKLLQAIVQRPTDLVARYGGEEFVMVLPDTPLTGAIHLATLIQSAVHDAQIPHRTSEVNEYVTLSIGVSCTVPRASMSQAQLLSTADQALYQAKVEGRDRIVAMDFTPE